MLKCFVECITLCCYQCLSLTIFHCLSGEDMYVDAELKEKPAQIRWFRGHNPLLVGDPRVTMIYDIANGNVKHPH